MSEQNTLLAVKNAWTSAVAASAPVEALAASVEALPADAVLTDAELENYHNVVLAQANAVMALRGLLEQLRRMLAKESA